MRRRSADEHLVARPRSSALRDPSRIGAKTWDLTAPQVILGGANPPAFNALDVSVAAALAGAMAG